MPSKDKVNQEVSKRRRWRRYHFTVSVRVTIEKLLHVSVIDSRSSKMNDGGLAVYADTELMIGDVANIEFATPHFDHALTLRGVVRNHTGNLYGVEFLATSATEREQLARFRQILRSKVGCIDA